MATSNSQAPTKLVLLLIGSGALLISGFLFLRCRSDVSGLSYCSTLGLVNPGAYKDRGIERSKNGEYTGSIDDFKKVIELNPKDADALYRIAVINGDNQYDYESALNYLKEADAISPNKKYKSKIAEYQSEIEKQKHEKVKIATAEITRKIQRNPSDILAFFDRGNIKYDLQDYQGAIADYSKAIAIYPQGDFVDILKMRGLAKYKLKDYKGAIADYSKAIAINPQDAALYNNRCYYLFLSKDYEKALSDCNQSISLDDSLVYAYDSRAEVKKALGNLEGACTDWDKAKELGIKDDKESQMILDKNHKENCS